MLDLSGFADRQFDDCSNDDEGEEGEEGDEPVGFWI